MNRRLAILSGLVLIGCGTNEVRPTLDAGAAIADADGRRVCDPSATGSSREPSILVTGGPVADGLWQAAESCGAEVACPSGASLGAALLEVNGRTDIPGDSLCPGDEVRVLVPILTESCSLGCQGVVGTASTPVDGSASDFVLPPLTCAGAADAYFDIAATLSEPGEYVFTATVAPDCPTRIDFSYSITLAPPQ